jgi:hypothetical protein
MKAGQSAYVCARLRPPGNPPSLKVEKVGSKLPFVILKNNHKVSEFIESSGVYLLYVCD